MRFPVEHAESYYAATRRSDAEYPRLEGNHRCDVVVVGAGFTGISAALHLAERGFQVAVVEANRVGWGASGRNGGQLIDGFANLHKIRRHLGSSAVDAVRRMGLECRNIVVDRIAHYGIDCDLKFGYIDVALRKREWRTLLDEVDDRRNHAYPHELRIVPAGEMERYVDTNRYLGGVINSGNGHLHPLNLCIGEARAAASLGTAIFEQTPVTRIRHGRRPAVETPSGIVQADKIVVAGNAYLGQTEPSLGGLVIPSGSYMMATAELGSTRALGLLPTDYAVCEQSIGLNYFRLSADNRLLFGGICNYSGRHPRDIARALRPRLLKIFPRLADVSIDFQWGGDIAISIKRIPQFGRIGADTYYAQGYSGHGLAPAHLAGKLLAEALEGDATRFDIFARIRHWRVPGGRWFANPVLALGMLYFRIRELL